MPKCILIVDDLDYVRKIIRNFLESESGYDAHAAGIDAVVKKEGNLSSLMASLQELLQEAQ